MAVPAARSGAIAAHHSRAHHAWPHAIARPVAALLRLDQGCCGKRGDTDESGSEQRFPKIHAIHFQTPFNWTFNNMEE